MKETPHHIGHEQQRDQHRDQRDGERDDGETDLLGALKRSGHGAFALLDVAGNVLDHHNRVIHHKASRNGQGH